MPADLRRLPRADRLAVERARQAWRLRALQVLNARHPLPRHPWGLPALLENVQVTAWDPGFPARPWPGAAEVVLSWLPDKPFEQTAWARHWNQAMGFPLGKGVPWTWWYDADRDVIVGHPFDLTGGPSGKLWLPQDQIDYAGADALRPWIGACEDGSTLTWDLPEWPHLLVGGSTGSGKSVCLRAILFHLLAADVLQALVVLDWKRRDFRDLRGRAWNPQTCEGVTVALPTLGADGFVSNLDAMEAAAKAVSGELGQRMKTAEDLGPHDYPWRRRLVVFVVDEALATLQREAPPADPKSDEAAAVKARNSQRDTIERTIHQVALMGRALNVHFVGGGSNFRKDVLKGEAVSAVQHRMYFGPWQDVAEPVVMFGTGQVQSPPPWKGYGIWRALRPDVDPLNPFLYFKGFWTPEDALSMALDGRVLPAAEWQTQAAWSEVPVSPWRRAA